MALKLELPIILINLNKNRARDENRCPAILRDALAIHISFEMNIIEYAIKHWPESHLKHKKNNDVSAFHYSLEQYRKLGL